LDYAVELGASALALGPIFASHTHGYDTVDYFAIDHRLGDDGDFDELVEQAHQRGLRIILDGVFNHVGRGFDVFQRALQGGIGADENRWFLPIAPGEASSPTGEVQYESFEGHDALVSLNHSEPAVADFVVEVMRHWLSRGADGWRLDAAYSVPTEFWANVLPRVRADYPDAYILGEVLHGDYSGFVESSTVDSVTQYELWKGIENSIEVRNFFELSHALERHNHFLASFVPYTFVGNHDVTRLASAITDERHIAHALVVLFTVGGTPSVYYGDEQGFRGIKENRAGGDDAVRPEFPEDGPAALAAEGWPLYHLHQELIGLRRRNSWLHGATVTNVELTNELYAYTVTDGTNRVGVALNISETTEEVQFEGLSSVLAGGAELSATGTGALVRVPAHGWVAIE
jgi:cyclomaltodextrinase